MTPAPIPTDEPAPGEPGGGHLAPGVTTAGVVDAEALADAHAAGLEGSYTVVANETVVAADGTLRSRVRVSLRLGPDHRRFLATLDLAGPDAPRVLGEGPTSGSFWSAGDGGFLAAVTEDGHTQYARFTPREWPGIGAAGDAGYWVYVVLPGGQPVGDIQPLFAGVDLRPVRSVEAGGRRRIVLAGSGLADAAAFRGLEGTETPRELSLRAELSTDGVVREYRLRYVARRGGETLRVSRSVRYAGVGTTTVERPAWAENVSGADAPTLPPALATQPSASRSADPST